MALINKVRTNDYMTKKAISLFASRVDEGTDPENIDGSTSNDYLLANLPADAIITNAYVYVETASDAATSAAATLGTTQGGTEILSAADLTTTGDQGTFTGKSLTGTGVELYLGVAIVGASTDVGQYKVVIEYVEYTKDNGEYTRI